MATIGNTFPNLIDLYKRQGRSGKILPVIEALTQLNVLMRDAYVQEANEGAKHKSIIRTGLPTPTWGKLYQGIPQSKSGTQQVEDVSGFVEGLSTIDSRILRDMKNGKELRADEGAAWLEAIAQEVQTNFFYSDTSTTPERFKGLAARYDTMTNTNVIDAGGSGSDNTSIWLVTWGRGRTGLFYPEGTQGGIQRDDKGEHPFTDDLGNTYFVKHEEFRQHVGVTVGDWRYNVRIANLDVSDMQAGTVDLYKWLRKALYKFEPTFADMKDNSNLPNPYLRGGKTVIYMNRTVLEALDAQSTNDAKLELRPSDLEGQMITTYRNIPIRPTDAIINAESRVV